MLVITRGYVICSTKVCASGLFGMALLYAGTRQRDYFFWMGWIILASISLGWLKSFWAWLKLTEPSIGHETPKKLPLLVGKGGKGSCGDVPLDLDWACFQKSHPQCSFSKVGFESSAVIIVIHYIFVHRNNENKLGCLFSPKAPQKNP